MKRAPGDNLHNFRFSLARGLLSLFIAVGFFFILAKAFRLQVLEHQDWLERERAQTRAKLDVPDYRGSIYDSRGRLLAFSVPQLSLFADGKLIENPGETASRLAEILGGSKASIEKKLSSKRRFIWIKRCLTDEQARAVRILRAKGLQFVTEYKRFYPLRRLAGQVLGFVGLDGVGLEGIEKTCDRIIRATDTVEGRFRDGLRRSLWLRTSPVPEPVEYSGLRLTLDAFIQHLAETELEKGAEKYRAKAGEVVVLDPRTFEVLAIANWPFFDPNQKSKESADVWRNRAVTDYFEPGSTFKIFLVTAALEENTVSLDDRVFCENGKFRLARHIINDVHPHGWLTIPEVIKYSSNIAAAKLALQLGKEKYAEYIYRFGFGAKTGIELPGEAKGLVRPSKSWRDIDLAATSFGQAIGVTALQLAVAVAAIANGGERAQPMLVKDILDANGKTIERFEPKRKYRIIRRVTAEKVQEMMRLVTEEGGTGTRAVPEGYRVAGKTGTAQVVDPETGRYASDKFTSLFIGFAPVKEPRLVVVVVIHEPKGAIYGGVVAAPIFRNIVGKALPYLGVTPLYEENIPAAGIRLANHGPGFKRKFPNRKNGPAGGVASESNDVGSSRVAWQASPLALRSKDDYQ